MKEAFEILKEDIKNAVVHSVNEEIPFTVETDASDFALAATLSQAGRPVAFFSRTLTPGEKRHPAVEKEAAAIIEAVRKWRHYLANHHFILITDQRSVSFMFDTKSKGKIKNDKLMRWRLELSCFSYDISFRPGRDNLSADAFSRVCGASSSTQSLSVEQLHNDLCHPGVRRLLHFIRAKNLPLSTVEVRKACLQCRSCAEVKPRFYKGGENALIKATIPFERLSIDFVGPKPSKTRNKYLLTIVDEYSRFPFAFACPDMTAATVINCLLQLFSVFGYPSYIHSDRGAQFMSAELKTFLTSRGIAQSRTTAYNPQGNGQCERYNGIIWKAIKLSLHQNRMEESCWETILQDALHSVRSLLCTTTNATPHERMFKHARKSSNGCSLPSWLCKEGPILLRRRNRQDKTEPLVDMVELVATNPNYAVVRCPDGSNEEEKEDDNPLEEPPTLFDNNSTESAMPCSPIVTHRRYPTRERKQPMRFSN